MDFTKTHNITAADSLKDIAKAVRADIKAAKKAGLLDSDLKVSVRTEYYSMGRTLHVNITKCSSPVINEAHIRFVDANPNDWHIIASPEGAENQYTDHAQAQADVVTEIVNAYNWNKSDSMTDYYHVNFSFVQCGFDFDLTCAEKKEIRARIAAEAEAQEAEVVEVAPVLALVETVEEEAEVVEAEAVEVEVEFADDLTKAEAEFAAAEKALTDAKKKVEAARLRAKAAELLAEAARLIEEANTLAA